tara:strand:- start:900 stop:1319 length:420 start_codon:yes stop_codon:yes gene_type:complete
MENVWKIMEGWRRYARDRYSVGTDPFYGPPPLINDVVDCWAQEGVRFYTDVHHANGMAYHVMLPTSELEFHLSHVPQSSNYNYISQDLIQDGYPPRAVRIVISKDGTATIQRDAEIVLAAKEVGLAQLPVLFVYEGSQQ